MLKDRELANKVANALENLVWKQNSLAQDSYEQQI